MRGGAVDEKGRDPDGCCPQVEYRGGRKVKNHGRIEEVGNPGPDAAYRIRNELTTEI